MGGHNTDVPPAQSWRALAVSNQTITMIQDEPRILDAFSKEFNARFNTLDFIDHSDKLMDILNKKVQKDERHLIHLPCKDVRTFDYLVSFRYSDLISQIIKRVKIEEESRDNYFSEMQSEMVQIYSDCISAMVEITIIEINNANKSFDIICPELFVELLWSPISQFHTQILIELEHLDKMVELTKSYMEMTSDKSNTSNLFINSKTSTAYSYFILAFVAENLKIPLKL